MDKLNGLLSQRDKLKAPVAEMLNESRNTFTRKQNHFTGIDKKFQTAEEDSPEHFPNEYKTPSTSVVERLDFMASRLERYINTFLSVEKTNASGLAKADLIVDGINLGNFSTLELMQLDKLVNKLKQVYEMIPTFDPQQNWSTVKSDNGWYETPSVRTVKSTNEKTWREISAANEFQKEAIVKEVMSIRIQGHYETKHLTTMMSPAEKDLILYRSLKLGLAIEASMKRANNIDAVPADAAKGILNYLHNGSI